MNRHGEVRNNTHIQTIQYKNTPDSYIQMFHNSEDMLDKKGV